METRALRRTPLATSLVVCLLCGCAGPVGVDAPDEEPPAPDEPLTMTVDAVDLSHGALRFFGTMDDGSADLTVQLGGDCEHREIGGGFATATGFVWSLSDTDLVDALPCNLRVRARAREGSRVVHKVADLAVALDMIAVDTDRGPQVRAIGVDGDAVNVGVSTEGGDDGDLDRFAIPLGEFARTVVLGRRPRLDGAEFYAWASIGAVAMEVQPVTLDTPDTPVDDAQEPEDSDPDGPYVEPAFEGEIDGVEEETEVVETFVAH
ncbi:MAG TPA: hypothetical protein VHV30_03645 [Polyangiaceae bacterium]|jgi:hypothetical protein|nr:hypothetical protein [Polyangiaceae bacterium]